MSPKKIAAKNLALKLAFENASEMIRSHGEEGFSFDDEMLHEEYSKAILFASRKIISLAAKYDKKYKSIGIEIDSSCDSSI